MSNLLRSIDLRDHQLLKALPHNPILDGIASLLSLVGTSGAIWVALAALISIRHQNIQPVTKVLVTLIATLVLIDILAKHLVARPRPLGYQPSFYIFYVQTYSFPSGHAASSFASAVVLSAADPKRTFWYYTLAVLISLSRLVIQAHYPSDIIVGALCGMMIGTSALLIIPS
jgi:undecaprenyl-diphosphatase